MTIYPRDYFYPLSYDHQYNVFTENTCMIHYYDATWTPDWQRKENKIYRLLGKKNGTKLINLARKSKSIVKKGCKVILYPAILYKRYKDKITPKYLADLDKTFTQLNDISKNNPQYIVFVNTNWLGVTNATRELFDNVISCAELFRKRILWLLLKRLKM